MATRRAISVGMLCVLMLGAFAFEVDVTTVRIVPDVMKPASFSTFPGALIRVELDGGWTPVRSSDTAVVSPMGGNWFVASRPGAATLSAASIRCHECLEASVLWRATIAVHLAPGS